MRHHANSPEIEPIRIPTGLDRNIGICVTIGVQATGSVEQVEIVIGELEQLPSKFRRQFGTTFAMPIVKAFVNSAGVVEDSE
jgi:hypothetical protein